MTPAHIIILTGIEVRITVNFVFCRAILTIFEKFSQMIRVCVTLRLSDRLMLHFVSFYGQTCLHTQIK